MESSNDKNPVNSKNGVIKSDNDDSDGVANASKFPIDSNSNDDCTRKKINKSSENENHEDQSSTYIVLLLFLNNKVEQVRQYVRYRILTWFTKYYRPEKYQKITTLLSTPKSIKYMILSIVSVYISRRLFQLFKRYHVHKNLHGNYNSTKRIRSIKISQQHQQEPSTAYSSATIVPLSFLLDLLQKQCTRDGDSNIIQRLLIGTNRILFQTNDYESNIRTDQCDSTTSSKTKSEWKSVQLPSTTTSAVLYQYILSLITSLVSKANKDSSVIDLNILPTKHDQATTSSESVLSNTISTILVTCIPFLYLAIVYRIIQKSSNNNNNSSSMIESDNDIQNLIHTNQYTKDMLSRNKKRSRSTNRQHNNNDDDNDNVTFNDVAGIEAAVQDMKQIVRYIHEPTLYDQYGAQVTRGILLYGPPGCGKTILVRALANEIGYCPFISCSASNFVEIYVGRGAARVRSVFRTIQQYAIRSYQYQKEQECEQDTSFVQRLVQIYTYKKRNPINQHKSLRKSCVAILFIDELDALAKTRSTGVRGVAGTIHSNDEREQTLNQLLTEMDGFHSYNAIAHSTNHHSIYTNSQQNTQLPPKPIIIVIGASNRVDVLDPAILRRFDRHINIGYPDEQGRRDIFQIHIRQLQRRMTTTTTTDPNPIDWDYLAKITHNMSGSDLRQIVNEAILLAIRDDPYYTNGLSRYINDNDTNPRTKGEQQVVVTQYYLEQAIIRHRQRSDGKRNEE